ncbi:DUF72 domain-containing protein [Acidiferrimicrobium sp. IK]|uniref:DUF72 domain-containing protein n=1 Tax=Acidiferrimicrobium sp. IK TaxID=2871700 RepID=UPI0021CB1C1F|nr:DUF72 domain-containing protein [Acidiferrimicrobium sp. IK]MCU4183548.1 DUF72 domain-containing protein [Acidiferrimicrobium sp. IK]
MPLLIGTSGWQYKDWRGRFYPGGVPVRSWLEHYSQRFATVEVNNAFYRLPEAATFEKWATATPDDFVVAVKASRYLTHVRRLQNPEEPVGRLLERTGALGAKLGPILLQLPPTLRADVTALDRTLRAFPRAVRVAVEPRHDSWWTPDTRACLEHHHAALCLADPGGPAPHWVTAEWGYVRFHRGRAHPSPCYGRQAISTWAQRLADMWDDDADVYAYFNNDTNGCAPRDARQLALAARRAGRRATRVPAAGETPVAG